MPAGQAPALSAHLHQLLHVALQCGELIDHGLHAALESGELVLKGPKLRLQLGDGLGVVCAAALNWQVLPSGQGAAGAGQQGGDRQQGGGWPAGGRGGCEGA